ncbi:DUF2179 domain-containing protein [candidate division KSB1 bacterium]|nr:DUF2179 domain-containing protein [candidate division KSB1 bacterium]
MTYSVFLGALLIFVARVTDVSLGTMRMIFIIQGRKYIAALVGLVEVTIFLLAIAKAISGIGNLFHVFAYSSGFAIGTLLGISIENRLALGWSHVRVISKKSDQITQILRENGFGVTVVDGRGLKGPIELVYTVVRRRQTGLVLKLVEAIDSAAFVTMHDSRHIFRGHMNPNKKK